jgi:hypothetical protein
VKSRAPIVDLEALARAVAPLVVAQLAMALGASGAPFSTRRGSEPPEFVGRAKKWRSVAPTIPGATKIGRWVVVPRDAYGRWLEDQSTERSPPRLAVSQRATEPWTAAAALASVGLRAGGMKR